jgi:LysR family glycine cleavage system transcriptional activator
LPPLGALRAFEAAARHLSFTKAAEELHVTQAAVSHHIKALEQGLGLPLFQRFNRRLALTNAGRDYLPPLRDAFDLMLAATQRITAGGQSGQLKITTLSSFATKWLIPRLSRFKELQPDIDPMISTSYQLVDLRSEEFDIAIRLGRGRYPGLHVVHLMDDLAFPVCSPRLQKGAHALRQPTDLKHHVLLHDSAVLQDSDAPHWGNWLKAAGVTEIAVDRGSAYSDTALTLQAAIAGNGVALGRRSLVADDIKAGHLVRPFGPELRTRFSWYLVCTPANAGQRKIRAFREWLESEIARDIQPGRKRPKRVRD